MPSPEQYLHQYRMSYYKLSVSGLLNISIQDNREMKTENYTLQNLYFLETLGRGVTHFVGFANPMQ